MTTAANSRAARYNRRQAAKRKSEKSQSPRSAKRLKNNRGTPSSSGKKSPKKSSARRIQSKTAAVVDESDGEEDESESGSGDESDSRQAWFATRSRTGSVPKLNVSNEWKHWSLPEMLSNVSFKGRRFLDKETLEVVRKGRRERERERERDSRKERGGGTEGLCSSSCCHWIDPDGPGLLQQNHIFLHHRRSVV